MGDAGKATATLTGFVSSRSTRNTGGPPGESEILRLNPERRMMILEHTDWPELEPGTLNIECDENELRQILDAREPELFESSETVVYPQPYAHIPTRRRGYRYYRVTVARVGVSCDVLLRRAVNPVRGRVELLASINLRKTLKLEDGDDVTVRLT